MATSRRALLGGLALPALAAAQPAPWPNRPLRVIVAWPPGGSTDVAARLVTAPMAAALGQPLVIENRGGATGAVGSAAAAGAVPDGYTWLVDASGQVVNAFLLRGLGFDYATAFVPVTQLTVLPALLLVRAESPVHSLEALLEGLRARPGAESYGSSGTGTASHLAGALLLRRAGLGAIHVPYRGGAQQIASLLAGETGFAFSTTPLPAPLVREGRLRALAVSTAGRIAAFPEVPTVAEAGVAGFDVFDWHGLFAPAGVPAPILARMAEAADAALREPELRARLALLGAEPVGAGPEAFATFLADQRQRMGALIRAEGIRLE